MALQKLNNGTGYLKAGFLGFPKSGKTFTSAMLAIGTRAFFDLKGPLAMYDTEGGSAYIQDRVKKATGKDLVGMRSRSLTDLLQLGKDCLTEGVAVLIVDSITHPWRELCESHLKKINIERKARNLPERKRLEFQDWNILKAMWAQWTDFYLNSPLHIIIAGRAGYEWDFTEPNDEDGKRELIKTGVKMKTESEFGFEPSLLVEMERVQQEVGRITKINHVATILGDRFGVIDGKQKENPDFDFFKPHLECLKPGASNVIDTELKTDTGVDDSGHQKEKRERIILLEEIEGEITRLFPGQSAEAKKAKGEIFDKYFQTRSWTKVEGMGAERLRDALNRIRIDFTPKQEEVKDAV